MVKVTDFSPELVERYGLPDDEALEFVESMFDIIREQLDAQDKQVKVKGLGTFKVTSVGARASVDVNTGERIIIEGRNKISFTPETLLRDRVNRPFVQFDTVVLNDGVDFSDIDREYKESKEADGEREADGENEIDAEGENGDEQDVTTGLNVEADNEPEPKNVEVLEQDAEKSEAEPAPESAHEPAPELEVDKEPGVMPVQEQSVEEATAVEPEQNVGHVAEEVSLSEPEEDATNSVEADAAPAEDKDEHVESVAPISCKQRNPRLMYWLTAASFLLLVCIGIGMYVIYQKIEARNTEIEQLQNRLAERVEKRAAASVVQKAASQKKAAVPAATVQHDSLAVKTPQKDVNDMTEEGDGNDVKKTTPAADYNSDVRVRTGAYVIVGTDHVVTVKQGQTLESISRALLGPGMECYVEAYNGCKEVKAGDRLKIPKLKLKKRL